MWISGKSSIKTGFRDLTCYQIANFGLFDNDIQTILKTGDYRYAMDRLPTEPDFKFSRFSLYGLYPCLLYTSPSPRDLSTSRMPSSA